MPDHLIIDHAGAAALVTLNRPQKRNALSIQLRLDLADAFAQLQADDSVAAIGLTGAGPAFCAGMDVTEFGGDAAHRELLVKASVRCFQAIAHCTKPTVALVNGPAIAGGFAISLLCDLRVAAPTARMGFPELGRFIPPSYAAAAWALPPAVARDLCLTGRLLDAHEALALGVVSRVSDSREVLDELAAAPAAATSEVKRRILEHQAGASADALLADEEQMLRAAVLGHS
ncbi:MAG: enoyl-CoA hydratase/isomerase family protein [Solirubrobacteraceae bacterium]